MAKLELSYTISISKTEALERSIFQPSKENKEEFLT